MKKYLLDLRLKENKMLSSDYFLLKLTSDERLPDMKPGQFVEVRVNSSPDTFLRRPVSVNFVDRESNELWLLIQQVGAGTRKLAACSVGETLNMLMPLGTGFTIPNAPEGQNLLLIGGGVGTAPLLFLGYQLKQAGFEPEFLLGARRKDDLVQISDFEQLGNVYVTTEDGSLGEKGFVTDHTLLQVQSSKFNVQGSRFKVQGSRFKVQGSRFKVQGSRRFDRIYTCGPKPMMIAVARYAAYHGIPCEASLENMMACGIGACLCCVEKTIEGHQCVCTEGPVFDINKLTWLT